ncbi:SHOCT domain-containing protein [Paracrocinitomix mangrovi]|uniref:SHOCT domain-containing protein n=1 Tax=Paracrocinitomix mangrovi TaxID=2862509 RepID=UPI001C8E57B3|nr:SHOCT domain-containing protein [Paracrocinitomix mangrovi]UKN01161.1 SHOCT domain-containing protein [Paracrocinitomix mangrovi]
MNTILLGMIGGGQVLAVFLLLLLGAGAIVLIVVYATKSTPQPTKQVQKPQVKPNIPPKITETKPLVEKKQIDHDTIEKLEKLNELKNKGALTEEEFQEQKKRLL